PGQNQPSSNGLQPNDGSTTGIWSSWTLGASTAVIQEISHGGLFAEKRPELKSGFTVPPGSPSRKPSTLSGPESPVPPSTRSHAMSSSRKDTASTPCPGRPATSSAMAFTGLRSSHPEG